MKRGAAAIADPSDFAYDDYRRRLDVQAVLDHYGAENAYEQTNHDGTTEIVHSCLIDRVEPHHSNGDASPSACANLDKKLYICYSYWGGDIFHLIAKMERKDNLSDVSDLIGQFLEGATKDDDHFLEEIDRSLAASDLGAHDSRLSAYSERVLQPWAFTHPYVVERGIDLETASRLQIGYDQRDNRITIPHYWQGKLVGWQKRTIPERPGEWPGTVPDQPKYKNSPGFPKSTTLYRADDITQRDRVCAVESPFSVIKAASVCPGLPVVATFGAKITDSQVELLAGFREVIIWMDSDDAGRQAEQRLVERLHERTVVRVVRPDDGMDMGDYDDKDALQAKIDSAVPALLYLMDADEEKKKWATRSRLYGR